MERKIRKGPFWLRADLINLKGSYVENFTALNCLCHWSGKTDQRERLSTVDLLIRVACLENQGK